ncbi:hypothetical protein [Hymenobacter wooponensis]|uniref:Uncharacterized protein n=1 Tax=Hymenobacter wooponensis TaxID=1525360 RepID=A0A4Z0MPS9_9BACT|nr:hypothetical protein [Hymenobacter wooponensis]TGD81641.1 hypothetical protein EU557_08845 [Hymenobacter wooponensis]
MKKDKNKKKADKTGKAGKSGKKTTLFGGAGKSLKKLGKGTGLAKLSTTQKVLGGAALLAVGLGYLGKRRNSTPAATPNSDAAAAEESLASMEGGGL